MPESTITAKGRTTVPAEVRSLVQAKPGTRLVWSVTPDGTITVRAKTKSILGMAGMLSPPKGTFAPVCQTWDGFFACGGPVSDDFLPERVSQQPPER